MFSRLANSSVPVAAMAASQVVLAVLIMVASGDWLQWAGLALILISLAGVAAIRYGRGDTGNDELLRVLRTVNEAQGDLSSHMDESGDSRSVETARLFNQFMERLRGALEDLRNHSINVTLTSAQGRKIAASCRQLQ